MSVLDGFIELFYLQVSMAQLIALKDRSTYCVQEVEIACSRFALTIGGGKWDSGDGDRL